MGRHRFDSKTSKSTSADAGAPESKFNKRKLVLGSKRHGAEVAKRQLRRQKLKYRDTVCFGCREKGHPISLCPNSNATNSGEADICYKCGSKEHKIQNCAVKVDPNNPFPFARCFVCQGIGHISRDCKMNEKGVYVHGGNCTFCNAVNHLAQDCPDKPLTQKQRKIKERSLLQKERLNSYVGVSDDTRQTGDDDGYLADSRIANLQATKTVKNTGARKLVSF